MELGWATAFQAVLIAASTWYVRRKSQDDRDRVIQSTAAQSTSNDILSRVQKIEVDLEILKLASLKDYVIDHRGPKKE